MAADRNVLELHKVYKGFARIGTDDVTHALEDINLTVTDGEFVSVVGPSGCGKSTILRLVAGLIVPTSGTLTLNGDPITGTDPERAWSFRSRPSSPGSPWSRT